jgi:hypothetical protein
MNQRNYKVKLWRYRANNSFREETVILSLVPNSLTNSTYRKEKNKNDERRG